jgi:hypothetical protein
LIVVDTNVLAELKALLKQLNAAAGTGGEERRHWA